MSSSHSSSDTSTLSPDLELQTESGFFGDRNSSFNPFLVVFIVVAWIIIVLYAMRCCWNRATTGNWLQSQEDNNGQIEGMSVRTERLPSFFKVVVLPDQDLCYAMASRPDDPGSTQKGKDLAEFLFKKDKYNKSFFKLQEDQEKDAPIRFFRTASIELNSETESTDPQNLQYENSDNTNYEYVQECCNLYQNIDEVQKISESNIRVEDIQDEIQSVQLQNMDNFQQFTTINDGNLQIVITAVQDADTEHERVQQETSRGQAAGDLEKNSSY